MYRPETALRRGLRALGGRAGRAGVAVAVTAVKTTLSVARARAKPAVRHLQENAYSIIGFGMFDAAMFVHSLFTGLMITGISWIVFEWKVQEGTHGSAQH